MLYLSIALVLIFALYLIDKHNAWKGAVKIVAALVALLILGAVGIYGWMKYEDWQGAKKREAQVTACMKTIIKGSIVFVRTGDDVNNVVKSFCEAHPGANIACGIKNDPDGNLTTYEIGDTDKGSPGKVCTAKGWDKDPMQEIEQVKADAAEWTNAEVRATCSNARTLPWTSVDGKSKQVTLDCTIENVSNKTVALLDAKKVEALFHLPDGHIVRGNAYLGSKDHEIPAHGQIEGGLFPGGDKECAVKQTDDDCVRAELMESHELLLRDKVNGTRYHVLIQ
jgi:uncharacterized membrane protein YsdA (DUF1294 family)